MIAMNNMVVKEVTAYMCSQAYDAMVIIRSKMVDIQDRHFRGTWNRLTKEEKRALMTCPTTPEAIQASWDLALKSSNYLRLV